MSTVGKPVGMPDVPATSHITTDSVGGSAGYGRPTAGGNATGSNTPAPAGAIPSNDITALPSAGNTAGGANGAPASSINPVDGNGNTDKNQRIPPNQRLPQTGPKTIGVVSGMGDPGPRPLGKGGK